MATTTAAPLVATSTARAAAFIPRPAPAPLDVAARDCNAEKLAREVARYLAAVAAFRAEDCAPLWRAETEEVGT